MIDRLIFYAITAIVGSFLFTYLSHWMAMYRDLYSKFHCRLIFDLFSTRPGFCRLLSTLSMVNSIVTQFAVLLKCSHWQPLAFGGEWIHLPVSGVVVFYPTFNAIILIWWLISRFPVNTDMTEDGCLTISKVHHVGWSIDSLMNEDVSELWIAFDYVIKYDFVFTLLI